MNMENIYQALEMMGQGMLGIFVVLGSIALLVALPCKSWTIKKLILSPGRKSWETKFPRSSFANRFEKCWAKS